MIIPILDEYYLSLDKWVIAALIALFTVYFFWLIQTFYTQSIMRSVRIPVIILRTASLILFIFIITDLSFVFSLWKTQSAHTLILYDLSRSMDSAWTRESLKEWHDHPLKVKLDKETRISRFGGGERGVKLRKTPETTDFIENVTDFDGLINSSLNRFQNIPDQIIFLTDGQNLKGMETEQISYPAGVQWIVIGVGDTLSNYLPVISEWSLPDYASVNDTIQVSAVILSDRDESINGKFFLNVNNKTIDSGQEIMLHPATAQVFTFTFVPQTPGIANLKIAFENNDNQTILLSGHSKLYVRPEKFSIIVDGSPHPDPAFVLHHIQPKDLYHIFTVKDWESVRGNDKPDLLILGPGHSIDATSFNTVPILQIADLSGRDYTNVSGFQIVRPFPFTALSSHPALDREIWVRFPPVFAPKSPVKGEPVILDDKEGIPLILIEKNPRKILLNGNGFWRWAWSGYNTEREGSWTELVNGMIEWLVSPQPDWAWIEMPDKEVLAGVSETIYLNRNRSVNPGELSVRIAVLDTLRSPVWNSTPLNLVKTTTPLRLPGLNAGSYCLTADIFRENEHLFRDSLFFYVGSPDPELLHTGCDMKTLRRWGSRQNGVALHLSEWENAEQFLDFSEKYKRYVYRIYFRKNICWILFLLLLLTTEWIIRKRSGVE